MLFSHPTTPTDGNKMKPNMELYQNKSGSKDPQQQTCESTDR